MVDVLGSAMAVCSLLRIFDAMSTVAVALCLLAVSQMVTSDPGFRFYEEFRGSKVVVSYDNRTILLNGERSLFLSGYDAAATVFPRDTRVFPVTGAPWAPSWSYEYSMSPPRERRR